MSEFKKTRDVSTWQKLPPPKSLQGEEDAEITWDLILKRYPNAAPLLCQMETVIDRAEGLLQQLRSPYTHALERSSSFQIADSEDELMGPCHIEESTEVSMISEQDSRFASVENMTPEIVSVAGCSLSDKISVDYHGQELKSELENQGCSEILKTVVSVEEKTWSPDVSSSSILEYNSKIVTEPEMKIEDNFDQEEKLKSIVSSVVNLAESPTESNKLLEEIQVEESSSLEAWGKVVGEIVIEKENLLLESKENSSGSGSNPKEDSVSEHARRLSSLKTGTNQQIGKLNLLGKKEELVQRFAGTIATASKIVDETRIVEKNSGEIKKTEAVAADGKTVLKDTREMKFSEKEIINEFGKLGENFLGDIEERKTEIGGKSSELIKKKAEFNEVQGNGDEAVATVGIGPRSPVEILEEYSKICGIPVEYKNLSPSCSYNKNAIVKCCLGGFAFDACAQGKKMAKKDAAAKLLRCLAGRQIDGENMTDLKPFDRKQIEEILNLGNKGENETAVRKLYKICMELNAEEPIYTVHQDSGIVGNRYTVKCAALGITTSGYGIRVLVAKKVAADKLLHNYHENRETQFVKCVARN